MDRTEKIGLGTAVGGHALLFGALSLGLLFSSQQLIQPKPIAVSLVGEVSDVSTAPDATQEETAAAASVPEDTPPDEPPPMPEVLPTPRVIPQPVTKPTTQPIKPAVSSTKPAVKKVAQQQPTKPATRPAQSSSGKGKTSSGGFKLPDELLNGKGKSTNNGQAAGTNAAKTAAQVKREVTVSLANEIEPFWRRCMPRGLDVNLIVTTLALNIAPDGRLTSASFLRQRGINDSNSPQAGLHKECALNAVRAASPFTNLPDEGYDVWKRWEMDFKRK